MFNRTEYPTLVAFVESMLILLREKVVVAEEIKVSISVETAEKWEAAVDRYCVWVMRLIVYLADHPERLSEAEQLLQPLGCPAQMIPKIERFVEGGCERG